MVDALRDGLEGALELLVEPVLVAEGADPVAATRSLSTTRARNGRPRNQRRGKSSISTTSARRARCAASQAGVSRWMTSTLTARTAGRRGRRTPSAPGRGGKAREDGAGNDLRHLQRPRRREAWRQGPGRAQEIDLLLLQPGHQGEQGEEVR